MYKRYFFPFLSAISPLLANPQGGSVQSGTASIKENGSTLEVHASDRTIIHWNDFSIQSGETTRFVQPNASSTVLNRVTGNHPSSLNGLLEANGRVVLINPHGVIIGPEGVIRVADFIASTYEILNLDNWSINTSREPLIQIAGKTPGAAINQQGLIQATGIEMREGKILLVANTIDQSGALSAPEGEIQLIAQQPLHFSGTADTSSFQQTSSEGILTLQSLQDVVLIGPGTAETPTLLNSGGTLSIIAEKDCIFSSGATDQKVLVQQTNAQFPLSITSNKGDVCFFSVSSDAPCKIAATGPLFITAPEGSCNFYADHPHINGQIAISSSDYLQIVAQNDITAHIAGSQNLYPNLLIRTTSQSGNPSLFKTARGSISFEAQGPSGQWQIEQTNTPTLFNAGTDCLFSSDSDRTSMMTLGLDTTLSAGQDIAFETGSTGHLTVKEKTHLTLNAARDLKLISTGEGSVEIIAVRTIDASVEGHFIAEKSIKDTTLRPIFFGSVGASSIQAGDSVSLGTLSTIGSGNGPITVKTRNHIEMQPTSSISLLSFIPGARHPITLIVDHLSTENSPIGTGAFIMHPGAAIGTDPQARAPVQIFTARQHQNKIHGLINNASFTPGAFNLNTATEQWGTSDLYGTLNSDPPHFTIFYKEPELGALFSIFSQTIGQAFGTIDEFADPMSPYREKFCIQESPQDPACFVVYVPNYRKYYHRSEGYTKPN